MDTTTTEERVTEIMRALDINQVELAALAGASKSMVNQWLSGSIKSVAARYAFRLQRKTGFNAEWLMTGEGPPRGEATAYPNREQLHDLRASEPCPADMSFQWPFTLVSMSRVAALSEHERGFVEGKLLAAIEDCETARSRKRQGNGDP